MKNDKFDLIKNTNLYTSNDTVKKVNRQPTKWEKKFTKCISDKGLVSWIKKHTQKSKNSDSTKTNSPTENCENIWINISPMVIRTWKDAQHLTIVGCLGNSN